jgi:hypothetical protein
MIRNLNRDETTSRANVRRTDLQIEPGGALRATIIQGTKEVSVQASDTVVTSSSAQTDLGPIAATPLLDRRICCVGLRESARTDSMCVSVKR